MLKIKIAALMALMAGTLTLAVGFTNDIRMLTLFYRFITSTVIFGLCGYVAGSVAVNYLDTIQYEKPQGRNLDIVSEQLDFKDLEDSSPFQPLTPENFERVSSQGN
ncbi:hypothetical protein [Acetonema longum]|uniref:Uncharacterized protein n=1 Tax=Acetonema longum DSM 6540 TaxID=1009370 RepID=F7NL70_9FIRM|nr:hypothetical protein [Acetonema longum]EGO63175.1 hypothetical protein ALO_14212 [Acetonema longum DSM 6540]